MAEVSLGPSVRVTVLDEVPSPGSSSLSGLLSTGAGGGEGEEEEERSGIFTILLGLLLSWERGRSSSDSDKMILDVEPSSGTRGEFEWVDTDVVGGEGSALERSSWSRGFLELFPLPLAPLLPFELFPLPLPLFFFLFLDESELLYHELCEVSDEGTSFLTSDGPASFCSDSEVSSSLLFFFGDLL